MSAAIEHYIQLDLDNAVRRVSSTIQADCRVLDFIVNDEGFSVSVAIGENLGQPEWRFVMNGTAIHIFAVEFDLWAELSVYYEVEDARRFWARAVEQMIDTFFHQNPKYHHAISW